MIEPDVELRATANLSPVSPSPVYTAAPLVVPALQDTVDTIDAMVAAAAGAVQGDHDKVAIESISAESAEPADNDDVVDDDSFNDPYGEDTEPGLSEQPQPQPRSQPEPSDSNDDYAKTFDSPIEPEEGDALDNEQHVSSSNPQESNQVSITSEQLTVNRSSEDSVAATSHDPSATSSTLPAVADRQDTAQIESAADPPAPAPPAQHNEDDQQKEGQSAQTKHPDGPESNVTESQNSSSLDIQKLVADLTAQPTDPKSDHDPSILSAQSEPPTGSASLPSTALPPTSSLPPRPPQPHSATASYASQHHPLGANPNTPVTHPIPGQAPSYHVGSAPGTSTDPSTNLPPPPTSGLNGLPYSNQTAAGYPSDQGHDVEYQHKWDQFMTDERQYMSEAKWDRFPDGSRIFIGNLSSDKVSKRDVFDLFHRHGRLAQISLKSAYGFVQYHTVEEGNRAMENLQGFEVKGRRIHLEISRVQDKSKKDRNRSPDRGRGRDSGRDGGRRSDKHGHTSRDDYRPGRNHSPRRSDFHHARDDGFGGRDRSYSDSGRGGRGRSRSPGYGRNDRDVYRRRSPSPHGRPRHEPELDLPRRYGSDVPDVQIILQPDVNRDFVNWVDGAFKSKGLKTEVMYLHPRFPKDQVIQRQAVEGVHAVVDLDVRAQSLGRIPAQVFDRSNGNSNVRFDQYVDLDPGTAAEVILRAKASAAPPNYNQGYGNTNTYQNPYSAHNQQATYNGGQQPVAYPPQPQPSAVSAADIASLMGQVDNATLQRLLSSMQGQGAAPSPPGVGGYAHGVPAVVPGAPNSQVDIQALLGSLGAVTAQHAPPHMPYGAPYGGQPPNGGGSARATGSSGDAAAQVQNIMAQLARFRQ
ncbi:nuclear polyadenylated RNA-binding protein 3 [Conoideocrella luteorostrata]|uniref:Nuclear polyadenylated RNA-binding protein 3 n=1 Tax=Conoideocrella luteorostrata TaxID=1105319 RepID=A0AAJ0FUC9_9HYPO|nr:nuclear polyadenylated RNA-binding protein 3 [Conoideocrella luteorostrata]